jgi:hypothetical protein
MSCRPVLITKGAEEWSGNGAWGPAGRLELGALLDTYADSMVRRPRLQSMLCPAASARRLRYARRDPTKFTASAQGCAVNACVTSQPSYPAIPRKPLAPKPGIARILTVLCSVIRVSAVCSARPIARDHRFMYAHSKLIGIDAMDKPMYFFSDTSSSLERNLPMSLFAEILTTHVPLTRL